MRHLFVLPLVFVSAACASGTALYNADFSPPTAPEIVRSLEIRGRYDAPRPTGQTVIYVDSVAVHHTRGEASTIVWKDDAGKWQRSQVSEVGPGGLLPVPQRLERNVSRTMTDEEAAALDRLIADRSLYDGKVRRSGTVGIGAPVHVMAIVTPFGRTTLSWDGRLEGAAGAVADIVLGKG